MKKFALHMGRKVRIAENFASPGITYLKRKPKQMSVDAMTKQVARKFPTYNCGTAKQPYYFSAGSPVREVVLFVRKLCRK